MAPLLYVINFSKLRFRIENETTLIVLQKSCRSKQYFRSCKLCMTEWSCSLDHFVDFSSIQFSSVLYVSVAPYTNVNAAECGVVTLCQ